MSFFLAPTETPLDLVTENMEKRGAHEERYSAIADLRDLDRQGLMLSPAEAARANGFVRVASLQGPTLDLAIVLDPLFLRDKKKFYAWLDKHPQHCTYDRRKQPKKSGRQATFFDGKAVV